MRNKKRYVYGIVLFLLLMILVGCSEKETPVDEGDIGTPEGVVIAYLTWFNEKDFNEIQSMIEQSTSVGDVYFVQTQQPPKTTLEMIESQYDFITHFYGADAWKNVVYELEEIIPDVPVADDSENDIDKESVALIKEYRASFVFQDMPHHLMGYENIHIILSNESGAWIVKEGLSWDKNLYDGADAPEYYKGSETIYRGINGDAQPEDIKSQLGVPTYEEENAAGGDDPSYLLEYEDASYYFVSHIDEDGNLVRYYLESIIVNAGDYSLPRNVKIGDTFYSVMEKLPREKDWLSDPYNCFYGVNTIDGFGGACFSYLDEEGISYDSIVLVPVEYTPYLKMEFTDGILKTAMLVFIQMQ